MVLFRHVVFWGTAAVIKLTLPRVITHLACDTAVASIISLWYPFICTIALLHKWRSVQSSKNNNDDTDDATVVAQTCNRRAPRARVQKSKNETESSPLVQRLFQAAMSPRRRGQETSHDTTEESMSDSAECWLKYWVVYALVSAASKLLVLIVGRAACTANLFLELQLVFYLWIHVVMGGDDDGHEENYPLEIVYRQLSSAAALMYDYTSCAIPDRTWEFFVGKMTSLLDVLVVIKLLSSEQKEWLIHVVQASAPFVPPAITLFMPGCFLTECGVLYCKSVVPSAKSRQALLTKDTTTPSLIMSLLEYWILHCLFDALLGLFSPILWWIPFSSHATYILWCCLQIPEKTAAYYDVWEEELMSFGLLSRRDESEFELLDVDKTVTASVVRFLYSKLPSAAEDEKDDDTNSGSHEATSEQENEGALVQDDDPIDLSGDNDSSTATQPLSQSKQQQVRQRRGRNRTSASGETDGTSQNLRRSTRQRRKPLNTIYSE